MKYLYTVERHIEQIDQENVNTLSPEENKVLDELIEACDKLTRPFPFSTFIISLDEDTGAFVIQPRDLL